MNYSGLLLAQSVWTLMIFRVVLGIIFLSDGFPKIKNLKTNPENFELLGFNPGKWVGRIVIFLESIGGAFLVLGIFTQYAALLLAVQMIISVCWNIWKEGEMNKDFYFRLILTVSALVVATNGGGSFSLGNYYNFF